MRYTCCNSVHFEHKDGMTVDFSHEAETKMVRLFNIYADLGKRQYEYCPGIFLLPSEVHAVEYLSQCDTSCKITDMAVALGITKGAVSKMAAKLEKMQLIRRYKYVSNQKEVYLDLTPLGIEVVHSHTNYHQSMRNALKQFFSGLTPEASETVMQFLSLYFEEMKNLSVIKK